MIYNYFFHEEAQNDYEDALNWYLRKSEKVAWDFITSVDKTLELVCHNPNRWRNEYKNYFELSLYKFPYTIIYSIDKEKKLITVISLFHQKRNPKTKYRKVD